MAIYEPPHPTSKTGFSSLASPRWRALRSWSYAVFAGLISVAVVILVVVVTEIQALGLLADGFESRSEIIDYNKLINRIDGLDDAFLVLVAITAIVFITWMWRAAKNNEALGRERPRFGPGWAIGGWFIPIAFLVIPILVMQDLWRGSDSAVPRGDQRWKIGDRSALVGWWWGLLIGSRVLNVTGNGVADPGGIENVRSGIQIQAVGNVMLVAAAVLGVLMVHRLSRRQEECLRIQNEQWAQQSGIAPTPPTPSDPPS